MEVNSLLVVVATIAQFILGAVWYSPLLFGRIWMRIMNITHLSKEEIKKLEKSMSLFYGLQFLLTLLMTISFANILVYMPNVTIYEAAFWLWSGFIAPVQISAVIWGNTAKKFWLSQISIMVGMQFVGLMLMAWILSF